MLDFMINEKESILTLVPQGRLSEGDFTKVSQEVDPYINKTGNLHGIIIYVESFPGWDTFSAMVEHLKFVNEHHKRVNCIAFVTNSILGDIAENIGNHFINAEVKHFSFDSFDEAHNWILDNKKNKGSK